MVFATLKTLSNIQRIVEAAGSTMDDVVQLSVLLADMGHFSRFNEIYKHYFQQPMPARTCLFAVKSLNRSIRETAVDLVRGAGVQKA
jgi:enamine deaminase RidA (YjgF/YER057c/UK114 family)